MIDKDKLKEYINSRYSDEYHINDIDLINLNKMRYYRTQVDVNSRYNGILNKDGSVEVIMIRIGWSGWKIVSAKSTTHKPEFTGTWAYHPNRTNRFGLEGYQEWLIDVRDKKLEELFSS